MNTETESDLASTVLLDPDGVWLLEAVKEVLSQPTTTGEKPVHVSESAHIVQVHPREHEGVQLLRFGFPAGSKVCLTARGGLMARQPGSDGGFLMLTYDDGLLVVTKRVMNPERR